MPVNEDFDEGRSCAETLDVSVKHGIVLMHVCWRWSVLLLENVNHYNGGREVQRSVNGRVLLIEGERLTFELLRKPDRLMVSLAALTVIL